MDDFDFDLDFDADEVFADDWEIGLGAMMAEEVATRTERNFAAELPDFATGLKTSSKGRLTRWTYGR